MVINVKIFTHLSFKVIACTFLVRNSYYHLQMGNVIHMSYLQKLSLIMQIAFSIFSVIVTFICFEDVTG